MITIVVGTVSPLFIEGNTYVLTTSCINAFGIGALLAYVEIVRPETKPIFIKWINFFAVLCSLLIIIHYFMFKFPIIFDRLFISIIAVSIIAHCRYSPKSFFVAKILENKTISFIGTISYGIYLFHNIVPRYWVSILSRWNIKTPSSIGDFSYIEFFIQTVFIIFLSYLSWIFIEKPILKFKDRIS